MTPVPPTMRPDSCVPSERYPVTIDPIYWCWLWESGTDRDGYGRTGDGKLAHKHVYEQEVGPVPADKALDHWCRRRNCCNPMHLEPVTQSVNERRKGWRHRAKMDVCCQRGHEKFRNGRRTPQGGIVCRLCE